MKKNRTKKSLLIALADYPGALQSAVHGLQEMFLMADALSEELSTGVNISTCTAVMGQDDFNVLIIPPCLEMGFCLEPDKAFLRWLNTLYQKGVLLCSVCAGAYLLAAAGLLKNRSATTHWNLADDFISRFPETCLREDQIMVNDHGIITAGGIMSWVDLGLELTAMYCGSSTARMLGKRMVVDTAHREQRFYKVFQPLTSHGDPLILKIQRIFEREIDKKISLSALADSMGISERTMLRRFKAAVGMSPINYIQRLRIQKSCDLLERTDDKIEMIGHKSGYLDPSAFRKVFHNHMGLTPGGYRKRFRNKLNLTGSSQD